MYSVNGVLIVVSRTTDWLIYIADQSSLEGMDDDYNQTDLTVNCLMRYSLKDTCKKMLYGCGKLSAGSC
jgi:hypothetical protein